MAFFLALLSGASYFIVIFALPTLQSKDTS
eukprot:COSAG02_NODE_43271_length_376_cov_0.927798_1_plen_29_part_10